MKISDIRIAVIGAGKISYSVTYALQKAGFQVDCVISRTKKSARLLASQFRIESYSDNLKSIPSSVNFFILAVPDSQIRITADALSKTPLSPDKKILVHLSGVETVDALLPLKKKGAQVGSIHLMQTFPSKAAVDLAGSYAALETENTRLYNFLSALLKQLGITAIKIKSKKKALYHLAGIYSSNFMVGNIFLAEKFFNSASDRKSFYSFMKIISESAMKNVFERQAINSLSGPVERGDKETILKHLIALDEYIKRSKNKKEAKSIKQNYVAQSLTLLQLIKERDGKIKRQHNEIEKILVKNEL